MSSNNIPSRHKQSTVIIGIILIMIGILLFVRAIIPGFPFNYFSWQLILIIIGIIYGVRTGFKHPVPYVLIIFGALSYTNHHLYHIPFYKALFLPIIVISIGILIIQKDKKSRQTLEQIDNTENNIPMTPITYEYQHNKAHNHSENLNFSESKQSSADDFININSFLGGNNIFVFSKNLMKADVNCIFGGADINLRQADFKNTVVFDLLTICGGIELKIPSNWKIKNELVVVLGGVSDKRTLYNSTPDDTKTIVLRGTVVMGGVEIKN